MFPIIIAFGSKAKTKLTPLDELLIKMEKSKKVEWAKVDALL